MGVFLEEHIVPITCESFATTSGWNAHELVMFHWPKKDYVPEGASSSQIRGPIGKGQLRHPVLEFSFQILL